MNFFPTILLLLRLLLGTWISIDKEKNDFSFYVIRLNSFFAQPNQLRVFVVWKQHFFFLLFWLIFCWRVGRWKKKRKKIKISYQLLCLARKWLEKWLLLWLLLPSWLRRRSNDNNQSFEFHTKLWYVNMKIVWNVELICKRRKTIMVKSSRLFWNECGEYVDR